MTIPPIKNFEGRHDCRTRLVIALEGATAYTAVAGAKNDEGTTPAACDVREDRVNVVFPVLPVGRYEYDFTLYDAESQEVAAWLRGVLTIRRVAAPVPESGEVAHALAGEWNAGDLTLELVAGLPGRDGKDGADGQPGKDGTTPEIGPNGNWYRDGADTGLPSVVVLDHSERTVTQTPAAGTLDNFDARGWQMAVAATGRITDVAVEARDNREIASPTPKWLKLWIRDGGARYHLATSTEARTQAVGQTAVWPFNAARVEAGQTLVVTAHDTPDGTGYGACALLSCRAVANTAGDGGIVTGADGGGMVPDWQVRYAVRMRVVDGVTSNGVDLATADDLAAHAGDAVAHVTASDRARWDAGGDGVTRADMEAYVAEYVAAHAPAVDLSDYQGPIRLRDEHGEDVLVAVAGDLDARHVQIGDVVTVQRTCVTISSPLDVHKIHTYDQLDISAGSRVVISSHGIYAMCRDEILMARGTMDSYSEHLRIDTSGYHAIGTEVLISGAHICISPDPYYPAPGYSPSIDVSLSNVTISADHYLWRTTSGGLHTAGVLSLAPTGDILTS